MKRLATTIGILVLATVTAVGAQQPVAPADPQQPAGQTQAPAPGQQPQQPGDPVGGTMPMMDMCREMMGGHGMMGGREMRGGHGMRGGRGMMGGGMMGPGMMGGGMMGGDPRAMAQMMEMRGEMMKAMSEIMLKHAKKLQETPPAK
jgi:hypothetical protein